MVSSLRLFDSEGHALAAIAFKTKAIAGAPLSSLGLESPNFLLTEFARCLQVWDKRISQKVHATGPEKPGSLDVFPPNDILLGLRQSFLQLVVKIILPANLNSRFRPVRVALVVVGTT
jgi:hypothetical protein